MKFNKFISIGLIVLFCCAPLSGCSKQWKMMKIGWMKYTADVNPPVRKFEVPKRHQWKPKGKRQIQATNQVMPTRDIWRQRHGGAMNADEITVAVGPMLELDWVAENDYFHAGPVIMDSQGDIYASPKFPYDKAKIIKYDGRTGKILWKIFSEKIPTGGSLPLVLDDPENPGKQIIYNGTLTEVMAIHPDGTIIYRKPTTLPPLPEKITLQNLGTYHNYGPNYNPVMDALVFVTGDGKVWGADRKTGEQVIEPFQLPGAIAPLKADRKIPKAVKKLVDGDLKFAFKGAPEGYEFSHQVAIVLGEGVNNSNFFSVDQRTGAMWITATDLDETDGKKDGVSEYGALYRIDVVSLTEGKYNWKFEIGAKLSFKGGSASTPSLRGDGKRGYVGDAYGSLIAFDYDCNIIWKHSLGSEKSGNQIIASVTVASDNDEVFCVTRRDVFKIIDKGTKAAVAWRSKFDLYENVDSQFHQWNLLTATITANGILFHAGVGPSIKLFGGTPTFCPVKVGVGILDRGTGKERWFADGLQKGQSSHAMTVPTIDGGIIIPHSPIRRAIARGIFEDRIHPVRGGLSKYSPKRIDIMLRDIAVAASGKINRGIDILSIQPEGTKTDLAEVKDLINQARFVAPKAITTGDITQEQWNTINGKFENIEELHCDWQKNRDVDLLKQSIKLLDEIIIFEEIHNER